MSVKGSFANFFKTGICIGNTQTFRLNEFYDSNTKNTGIVFFTNKRQNTFSSSYIIRGFVDYIKGSQWCIL